jgi:hypothetical protein
MDIYNPDTNLFGELESFLRFYYATDYPISIYKPQSDIKNIFFNTEQLTREDCRYFANSQISNQNIHEIWDYSIINVEIWNSLGFLNTKHIPLKIWPDYQNKLMSYKTESYDFDVGFCGWVGGEHRYSIINNIKQNNISIDLIENLYGEERDKRLSKCKIILNMHFNESYKIFEQFRCFAWLDIGKTVVSENSLDNDNRCINVDSNEISNTLRRLLNK